MGISWGRRFLDGHGGFRFRRVLHHVQVSPPPGANKSLRNFVASGNDNLSVRQTGVSLQIGLDDVVYHSN